MLRIANKKLIMSVLNLINENTKMHDTLADRILQSGDAPRVEIWNYCFITGILNYLAVLTRPNLIFSVHQCTCFCESLIFVHEKTAKHIGQYLLKTRDKDIMFDPK